MKEILNGTGYYHQYLIKSDCKKNCVLYFRFSYLYLFPAGKIVVYSPSQGTNREKYY